MRVGLVTAWYDCGAGYVSKAYEAALRTAGHEVFVLARGGEQPPEDPYWRGGNVRIAARHSSLTGVHRTEIRDWIRSSGLEVVVFNEQRHWGALIAAREENVVTAAYVDYYRSDSVPFFEIYDGVICHTRRHHEVFGWHPQAHMVPWGTDCEVFRPMPRLDRPITFFHSGGWGGPSDRKGTGLALEAFSRVRGSTRLVVHAQRSLATCPEPWRKQVASDPRIEFVEGTIRPPGLYHRGDVYVYPARLDGIGLSVPEAMASGLAAIVPDEPPWSEFVGPGEGTLLPVARRTARPDGYYWPEVMVRVDDLTEAMQACVDRPQETLVKGSYARTRALESLNWSYGGNALAAVIGQMKRRPDVGGRLFDAALRQDLDTNPTITQQWARANWRLLKSLGKAVADLLPRRPGAAANR